VLSPLRMQRRLAVFFWSVKRFELENLREGALRAPPGADAASISEWQNKENRAPLRTRTRRLCFVSASGRAARKSLLLRRKPTSFQRSLPRSAIFTFGELSWRSRLYLLNKWHGTSPGFYQSFYVSHTKGASPRGRFYKSHPFIGTATCVMYSFFLSPRLGGPSRYTERNGPAVSIPFSSI